MRGKKGNLEMVVVSEEKRRTLLSYVLLQEILDLEDAEEEREGRTGNTPVTEAVAMSHVSGAPLPIL